MTVGATGPLVIESGSPVFLLYIFTPPPTDGPLVLESGMHYHYPLPHTMCSVPKRNTGKSLNHYHYPHSPYNVFCT